LIDLFNALQRLCGGSEYPQWVGIPLERTPTLSLGLQPGEWVTVKTKAQILQNLDKRNRNRGLGFDREMLRYCARRCQVLRRFDRLIDEKSGRLFGSRPGASSSTDDGTRGVLSFNPQNDYILW
jgi:hypothetical protein